MTAVLRLILLLATTPFPKRKPEGRRAWMHAVFRHGMDAVSKNRDCTASTKFALSRKALFFGSFLLGQQKK